jgi:hypothetical protein
MQMACEMPYGTYWICSPLQDSALKLFSMGKWYAERTNLHSHAERL